MDPVLMSDVGAMPPPKFHASNTVRLIASPSEVGSIVGTPRCFNRTYSYRVNFAGRKANYNEDDLELCEAGEDPRDLFLSGGLGDRDSCLLFLTFLRISGNLSNYYYSFYSSRTKFYPHQFKPLIKFLDSMHGRILLADEVGLGKTIEAGLILLELAARHEFQRAVIMCPAKLRNKWYGEMYSRFGLKFDICDSSRMLGVLHDLQRHPNAEVKVIVSYESARTKRVREALAESLAELDIVIIDEAHRLRNRETAQYRAGAVMADITQRMLLLTATPVNNRSEDLFNLLHLLDPNWFASFEYFDRLSAVNKRVVELEQLVRLPAGTGRAKALELMDSLEQSAFANRFKGNYFFDKLRGMLKNGQLRAEKDQIEAQRLALKINLLSGHIARSRRTDVEETRPTRVPHLCRVTPAPEEQALYQGVYQYLIEHYNHFPLPVMNMERILSSCIPAFIETYGRARPAAEAQEGMDDTPWDEDEDENEEEKGEGPPASGLAAVLRKFGPPIVEKQVDSKLKALLEALRKLDSADPQCKIIIFSYFKPTLAYLERKLRKAGYDSVVIHGDVPTNPEDPENDERENRCRRFADPASGVRILLSSEVGSEGLDFQFSHVVVNYDLPWNPMRVEQRIGRIDRIAQQSEKLLIYSLVLKNTIDEIIYDKLLTKIRIFESCLGDIESILGTEVREMRDAMFDPKLTMVERRERADRAAQIIEKNLAEARELEEASAKVVGTDQYIRDEIDRIQSSKRYVGPEELQRLIHHVFASPHLNLLVEEPKPKMFRARMTPSAISFFERHLDATPNANVFRAALMRPDMQWTFDYDVATLSPRVELFNLRHPAVRAVCAYLEHEAQYLKPAFIVRLKREPGLKLRPGILVLATFAVEYKVLLGGAPRVRKELLSLAWEARTGKVLDDTFSGAILSEVIARAEDVDRTDVLPTECAQQAVSDIEQSAQETFERRKTEILGEENAFLKQRREQIIDQAQRKQRSNEQRKETLQRQLSSVEIASDDKRIRQIETLIKAADGWISSTEAKLQANLQEFPENAEVVMSWSLRSVGTVVVE